MPDQDPSVSKRTPPSAGRENALPAGHPKALWAMVLGIAAVLFTLVCGLGFVVGVAAIIVGRQAQEEIDASQGALTGRGKATAGFVLGIVSIAFAVIWIVLVKTGVLHYHVTKKS